MRNLLIFILLLLSSPALFTQTYITSAITRDTTLTAVGNPYYISGYIDVPDSVTLTLEAGVNIRLGEPGFLRVFGTIITKGVPGNTVLIEDSASNSGIPWNNFLIDGKAQLTHTRFSGIKDILVRSSDSSFTLKNCEFTDLYDGLYCDRDSAIVDSCVFENCDQAVWFSYHAQVTNCRFYQNRGIGLILDGGGIASNCTFIENKLGLGSQNPEAQVQIMHSTFENNETGVYLITTYQINRTMTPDTFIVQNNVFILDTSVQQNGKTIMVADSIEAALLTFKDNTLCSDLDFFHIYDQPILDLSDNCYCSLDSNQIAGKIQWFNTSAPFNPYIFAPFYSDCVPDGVYPGDTDYDRVADMHDILPIGLYFNQTGPLRPNASTAWVGQPSTDWGTAQINGKDIKHVDTNGDGTINSDDTLAIQLNYGSTHRSFKNGGNGSPLILQPRQAMEAPASGDTVILDLLWGNMDTIIHNAYGLVASIQYDTSQISDAWVQFSNSWLGNPATNLLTMQRHDALSGHIDLGMVRTDGMNTSGFGQVGSIIVVIDDDIFKRQVPLQLSFVDVYAIDSTGAEVEVAPRVNNVFVVTSTSEDLTQNTFSVFPNPVRDGFVHISFSGKTEADHLLLLNMQGQIIHQQNLKATDRRLSIPVDRLPQGMYFIKTTFGTRSKTVKFVKQ